MDYYIPHCRFISIYTLDARMQAGRALSGATAVVDACTRLPSGVESRVALMACRCVKAMKAACSGGAFPNNPKSCKIDKIGAVSSSCRVFTFWRSFPVIAEARMVYPKRTGCEICITEKGHCRFKSLAAYVALQAMQEQGRTCFP